MGSYDHTESCGCRWIKVGGRWHQVVACPGHELDYRPHDGLPPR
jgi:hypothetical protein